MFDFAGIWWAVVTADAVSCKLKINHPNTLDYEVSVQEFVDMVRRTPTNIVSDLGEDPNDYTTSFGITLAYAQNNGVTLESHYPYRAHVFQRMVPPEVDMIFNLIHIKHIMTF